MANIKISQLTPKGANLGASDLLEISEFNGSGYETKSITGQEIIDAIPAGAAVNPTSGVMPINDSGSFADSTLSSWTNDNIRQVQPSGTPSTFGIFTDADLYNIVPNPEDGIQWGITNMDPGSFGTDTFLDCSIGLRTPMAGFFGSGLAFRGQTSLVSSPSSVNTQVTLFSVDPFNFMTYSGGTTVYGGDAFSLQGAYFNVIGDSGFPPYYKSDYAVARFDGVMTAVVLPKIDSSSQSMMAAEDGMIVYNATTGKFQGYASGTWVNLH